MDSAITYGTAALPAAAAWDADDVMLDRFKRLRDERWMETTDHPGFLRRSSWLYPDDGCFARAGLAIMNLLKWKFPAPSKIFVFGDLNVKTANSAGGGVSWWYHVAPLVEVKGQKYVLDPAIEPRQPLKLDDWLKTMTANPASLQVAICGSGSYTPDDLCDKISDGVESSANGDQPYYLGLEWSRMTELSRDPQKVLGDSPPWLAPLVTGLLAPGF
jgi:hypothetical protein